MAFKKAERRQQKLRLALYGASGSGKTFTALALAKHLGQSVGVIDTERGSASLYAGSVAEFDTNELTSFSPAEYLKAMREAAAAGFDVLVIDSLSHGWNAKGSILDQAGAKGNQFGAWRQLTPQQNELIDAILAYPGHVIVTMRAKTEYSIDKDDNGKTVVSKLGLAPVQRNDVEYEFTLAGLMDQSNTLHVTKTRCAPAVVAEESIRKPGEELAKRLLAWLTSGAEPAPLPEAPKSAPRAAASMEDRINAARAKLAAVGTKAEYEAFTKLMKSSATPDEIRLALSADWIKKGTEFVEPAVVEGDAAQ